jgi:hypothetical protein
MMLQVNTGKEYINSEIKLTVTKQYIIDLYRNK